MTRIKAGLLLLSALVGLAGCGAGGAPQPLFTLSGKVLDDKNQPIAGAVVTDGQGSTLSDETGRYSLAVFDTAIAICKPGRADVHFEAKQGESPTSHMAVGAAAARVGVDSRYGSPGLSGLRAALATTASQLADYPDTPLSKLDVLVMVTPGQVPDSEVGAIARWVHAGGRLVLCGEWGGYPDQDMEVLNALAQPAGITFTGATVKTSTGGAENWNSVSGISPASLATLAAGTKGADDSVYLYSTSALSLDQPAKAVLQSDQHAYSVLGLSSGRVGTQVLAAVGASGEGKVFALADSSLWKDEDTDNVGKPNVQQGANGRLAGALVKW